MKIEAMNDKEDIMECSCFETGVVLDVRELRGAMR